MKTLSTLVAATLLTAACSSLSGTMMNFSSWDLDRDTVISRAEFTSAVSGPGSWDKNGDNNLDASEFAALDTAATFESFDTDANGTISGAEYEVALFKAFDTNEDGFVQRAEFHAARATYFA